MTVHAQSVIPTWVNDYHPGFYTSLTTKENWSYTNDVIIPPVYPAVDPTIISGITLYLPLFTTLADKLILWKEGSYQTIVSEIVPLISGVYGLATTFNAVENLVTGEKSVNQMILPTDAYTLFGINGFVAATLLRVDSYYSDVTEAGVSALLDADIAIVTGAIVADIAAAEAAKPGLYNNLKTFGARAAFETPTGTAPSMTQKKQKIFTDLHYHNIYSIFKVGMPDPSV